MILRVIDIETTGMEPPAEIVEVGWCDVAPDESGARIGHVFGALYSAPNGIPPETMAVHHITPTMVADRPPCSIDDLREFATGYGAAAMVAHNAEFERRWFTDAVRGSVPMICTYKAALRVWPEAPAHTNQVLRYWLGMDLPAHLAMPPHRAMPDAYVTAHILVELLKHASVADLIQWTAEPRIMPRIPFGKHRGAKWSDVPADYLDWLVFKSDLDADTKWNARRELEARRKSA